jgi:hypothetical protein
MSDTFNDLGDDELHESNTVQLLRLVRSPSVEVSITTMERPVSPPPSISGNIVLPAPGPMRKGKGKGKAKIKTDPRITITRELKVDEIIDLLIVPSTFSVPRHPTALRIDLSKVEGHLTTAAVGLPPVPVESTGNPRHVPCSTRPSERFPALQRDGTAHGTAVPGTRLCSQVAWVVFDMNLTYDSV